MKSALSPRAAANRSFAVKFVALLACALAALPGAIHAQCRLQRGAILPLTWANDRIFVPVTMNNVTGNFMVDTGAAVTTLGSDFAARAHIGLDSHAGQRFTVGAGGKRTLDLWNGHVRMTKVGAMAFGDWEYLVLSEPLDAQNKVDGLLGADFLHYFDIDIDLPGHTMTVWRLYDCKNIHPEWRGDYDAMDLKPTKGGALGLTIGVDNAFLDMLLDTGGNLLLSRNAARKAGATDAALQADRALAARGIGGAFGIAEHRFNTVLIGSGEYDHLKVPVQADDHADSYADIFAGRDGLIGLSDLHADRIWISYTTNTLFTQTAKQAASPAPK